MTLQEVSPGYDRRSGFKQEQRLDATRYSEFAKDKIAPPAPAPLHPASKKRHP